MVIGMKYGRTGLDDIEDKEKTYSVARAFLAEFLRREHGTCCTDLIGLDLSDPKNVAVAKENGLFHTKCLRYVCDSAEILEKVL